MGLIPKDFWSHSLREWQYRVRGYNKKMGYDEVETPLDSDSLKDLMEAYPDDAR